MERKEERRDRKLKKINKEEKKLDKIKSDTTSSNSSYRIFKMQTIEKNYAPVFCFIKDNSNISNNYFPILLPKSNFTIRRLELSVNPNKNPPLTSHFG